MRERLAAPEAERTACGNLLRRTTGCENGPSDEERKARIKRLSGELKQARKDLEYCADIAERSTPDLCKLFQIFINPLMKY